MPIPWIAVSASYDTAVMADQPLGYWKLDETGTLTIADASGNGRDGTLAKDGGAFGYTQGVAGLVKGSPGALQLVNHSSQGDYVDLSNPAAFRLTTAFTLEAWVLVPNGQAAEPAVIAQQYDGGSVNYELGFYDGSNESLKPSVGFYNGSWHVAQSAASVSTAVAHHLVGTWDNTTLVMYVDGSQVASSVPGAVPTTPSTRNYRLGSRWDNGGLYYVTATLDDVAIYGTTLSASRVAAHYAAGH